MTLLIGMSKAEGVYLSADFRVTHHPSGRLIDDKTPKMMTIHYPPLSKGARALLACTGIAEVPDGTPVVTWIRETLRGESDTPPKSMSHLKERLDRDVALRQGSPLIINILAVFGDHRYFGALSNMRPDGSTLPNFRYMMQEVPKPFVFGNGSGARCLDSHLKLLKSQLNVRPRKALDHMNLLASINRKVAATDRTVSPASHVAFLPATQDSGDEFFTPQSKTFKKRGEPVPAVMPLLIFGIDLTRSMEDFIKSVPQLAKGLQPPIDVAEMNKSVMRRP